MNCALSSPFLRTSLTISRQRALLNRNRLQTIWYDKNFIYNFQSNLAKQVAVAPQELHGFRYGYAVS
jgi:hypothetical protein